MRNQNPSTIASLGEEQPSDNADLPRVRMGNSNVRLQASQWRIALDASDQIETLWPLFEAWLEASPDNERAYHLAERARCETEALRTLLLDCTAARDEEMTRESLLAVLGVLGVVPKSRWRRVVRVFVSPWLSRARQAWRA
jgi:ferric-dicitrate binding protein FerR (iron transport regulator)